MEPNIDLHDNFKLVDIDTALETADVFAVLVNHRQFANASIKTKLAEREVLDICGALLD